MDTSSRTTPALEAKEAQALARALAAGDVTVFVDGTALRLPPGARDAVLDLLARLGSGTAVTVLNAAKPADTDAPAADTGHAAGRADSASAPDPGSRRASGAPGTPLLTTSQAAAAAGISHTYLRNLTDAGVIPVEYRGSHRRIRMEDIQDWLAAQQRARQERQDR